MRAVTVSEYGAAPRAFPRDNPSLWDGPTAETWRLIRDLTGPDTAKRHGRTVPAQLLEENAWLSTLRAIAELTELDLDGTCSGRLRRVGGVLQPQVVHDGTGGVVRFLGAV